MRRIKKYDDCQSFGDVIRLRRTAANLRRGYIDLLCRILLIVLICVLLFTQVFMVVQAHGAGMFPAVKDGDLIIGFRMQREYMKDDVVIYEAGGQRRTGRIAARETDVVMMDESGTLFVNGAVQGGEILYPSYAGKGVKYPYRVPEGHVFIMGDYRTKSEDSREFGPISEEKVEAKVITILRRQGI